VYTLVTLSAVLGCDGSPSDGDGSSADGSVQAEPDAQICAGDRGTGESSALVELAMCTTITGNLSVTSSSSLELPRLTSIGGFLTIWENPTLAHVSLPKLTRIGGYLDVSANKALTSVRLPALETVNDRDLDSVWDVAIKDNALLPACEAEAVRDRLLARGFKGTISVSGTAGTCSP
jgi:hypothetical protein